MSTFQDEAKLNLALQLDTGLRDNMLQHGLIMRLVDGRYILTPKGEHEMAERDRHVALFEAMERSRGNRSQ